MRSWSHGLSILRHAADLGVEVTARTLVGLFVECLRAQTDCMTRLESIDTNEVRTVAISAPGLEQLLVEFLSEAIYLHETEGLVLCGAELDIDKVNEGWSLTGRVHGEVFDLPRHGLKTLLKAVTYHQLALRRHGGYWTARVIFDI